MKNKRPQGIQIGIVCLVFGLAGAIATYITMMNGKVLTTVLAMTPALLLMGIAFLVMPGSNPPPEIPDKERAKHWWKNSPVSAKAVWIIAGLAGAALGLTLVFKYTDFVN